MIEHDNDTDINSDGHDDVDGKEDENVSDEETVVEVLDFEIEVLESKDMVDFDPQEEVTDLTIPYIGVQEQPPRLLETIIMDKDTTNTTIFRNNPWTCDIPISYDRGHVCKNCKKQIDKVCK